MWNDLSLPWQACIEEAWTAFYHGSHAIGAAVTDANGVILSRGRNRIGEDTAPPPYFAKNTLAHAELNALLALDYTNIDPYTCSLYTTCEPCPLCLGAFYMSSLRTLHYASREPYAGSTNRLGTTPYLSRKAIHVYEPENPILEMVLVAMEVEYHLYNSSGKPHMVLMDTWRQAIPRGVELGYRLYLSEELRSMGKNRIPAAEALDCLVSQLS